MYSKQAPLPLSDAKRNFLQKRFSRAHTPFSESGNHRRVPTQEAALALCSSNLLAVFLLAWQTRQSTENASSFFPLYYVPLKIQIRAQVHTLFIYLPCKRMMHRKKALQMFYSKGTHKIIHYDFRTTCVALAK